LIVASAGDIRWRSEPELADVVKIKELVTATGFFSPAEIDIAGELVEARLTSGDASGYHFVLAEQAGQLAAYACFGPISGTESAFDLYWIATHPIAQGEGLGRAVLTRAESTMRSLGATRHYAETSSTDLYAPTRAFYRATGFREVAHIVDFYRPGDGKIIYERVL
jgi:GNAT superfamily N-acetyltransferase